MEHCRQWHELNVIKFETEKILKVKDVAKTFVVETCLYPEAKYKEREEPPEPKNISVLLLYSIYTKYTTISTAAHTVTNNTKKKIQKM